MDAELVQLASGGEARECRIFPRGRFELFNVGGKTFGLATYAPGWKWSDDVGKGLGDTHCRVSHIGYVVSGACAIGFQDGSVVELRQGTFFHIPAVPHDSWVIGDEPYVSLHLDHPEDYAAAREA
jgi:hypothetical protein